MYKLIALELKRNRLRPYHIATLICGVTMLGFQYLMAAIPHMDPTEPDAQLFSQYPFLTGITSLVCMAVFSILSAVMASRFVVEEYSGKRAILLLSYPNQPEKGAVGKAGVGAALCRWRYAPVWIGSPNGILPDGVPVSHLF